MPVYLQWHKSFLDERGYERKKYKKPCMRSTPIHMCMHTHPITLTQLYRLPFSLSLIEYVSSFTWGGMKSSLERERGLNHQTKDSIQIQFGEPLNLLCYLQKPGWPKVATALESSQMLFWTKEFHLLFGQFVKFTPLKSPQAAYGQLYCQRVSTYTTFTSGKNPMKAAEAHEPPFSPRGTVHRPCLWGLRQRTMTALIRWSRAA